jgi:aerobic-type carbon monoxide dehydrogenase small subunit (CoxS/CutS family)
MRKQEIQLEINGNTYSISVLPQRTLLEVLREDLGLIGTKEGCSEGECGVCTVLLDGFPVRSCLLLVVDVRGRKINTIEGLSKNGRLHPIQNAFIEQGAIQCGFCTPGMILSAKALLDEKPSPTEEEIRMGLSGNLCRCTGYVKIFKAVQAVTLR